MIPVTELRAGTVFRDSQGIWEVLEYKHIKMGRGSATIRLKVKNLKTANIIEKTFTSGQKIENIELYKKKGQFLYLDNDDLVFMDPVTFEQFNLVKASAAGKEIFLKEGETYDLSGTEESVLGVEIPKLVVLAVTETGPGVKGDTVSNMYKDAILENGLKVKVPLFVDQGEKVRVDTRSKEYVERVK